MTRPGSWLLLLVLPLVGLFVAQAVRPIAGVSSLLVRLALLLPVFLVAAIVMWQVRRRGGPHWVEYLIVLCVTAAVVPIHAWVPPLPD